MRLSVERLRWLLIAGGSVLVLALAGWIAWGHYRFVLNGERILKRSGASVIHESNGVTYSQSVAGKTVYTLHAAKTVDHGDGKFGLHDVVLTLYGRVAGRADRIYGSDFEYDEKAGVARALGEVHMDLQAPAALATAGRASPEGLDEAAPGHAEGEAAGGDSGDMIHVRTSGLVYMRKLDVAATDQDVEFMYRGVQCHAKGAEVSSQTMLHLLADVHLQTDVHGQPVDVRATKADMDRTTNVVVLQSPVVRSGIRTGTASTAVLHLRKDGSLERAEAQGNVLLRSGEQSIGGNRMDASFDAQMLAQKAVLTGDVKLADTNAARPAHGTAAEVQMSFDAQGAPTNVVATKADLHSFATGADGQPLQRVMAGDRMVGKLVHEGRKGPTRLSELVVTGSAKATGESVQSAVSAGRGVSARAAGRKTTAVAADDLVASFGADAAGRSVLERMNGRGHTLLAQSGTDGAQQSSSGDTLAMTFATQAGGASAAGEKSAGQAVAVASAVQTGHVTVHSVAAQKAGAAAPQPLVATAQTARYTAAANRLDLTGGTQMEQGNLSLRAVNVALDTATSDADAEGSVVGTVANSAAGSTALPTHILADRAHMVHATQVGEFSGTDAHPAKMWQGPSQVEAARLILNGADKTLHARTSSVGAQVHAVFAEVPRTAVVVEKTAEDGAKRKGGAGSGNGPGTGFVRVASDTMDYSDVRREGLFSGKVHVEGTLGEAHADRGVVVLDPAKPGQAGGAKDAAQAGPVGNGMFGGSVQRVVLLGGVVMEQPGRRATGEQLTYTAATGDYVLTGSGVRPPLVVDATQGSVTGATLLFGGEGSNIVVAGQNNGKTAPDRVRTDIVVRHR
jgi:lipopolysaccharide export system protein LptA